MYVSRDTYLLHSKTLSYLDHDLKLSWQRSKALYLVNYILDRLEISLYFRNTIFKSRIKPSLLNLCIAARTCDTEVKFVEWDERRLCLNEWEGRYTTTTIWVSTYPLAKSSNVCQGQNHTFFPLAPTMIGGETTALKNFSFWSWKVV